MGELLELGAICALADREAAAGAASGRLMSSTVDALRDGGLFKALLPVDLGGRALHLGEACSVIARLAESDGATGWAVAIGAGPNWFAGHMSPALATEVFAPGGSVVAGSGVPGTAEVAGDGYRVRGQWRWCSGAPWATWFTFTATATTGEGFAFAVPAGEVELRPDSWDVRGLRATASWDAVLDGTSVTRDRTFAVDESSPTRTEPIFLVPFAALAHATMASVSVGLVRRALAEFMALARTKRPQLATGVMADDPVILDQVARGVGAARAAADYLTSATAELWNACRVGDPPGCDLRTDLQIAACHAVATGARVASRLWSLAGMTVLAHDSDLGRAVADLHAVSQNAFVSTARFADAGSALVSGGRA